VRGADQTLLSCVRCAICAAHRSQLAQNTINDLLWRQTNTPAVVVQVNDELERMIRRLERLRLVHLAAASDRAASAASVPAAAQAAPAAAPPPRPQCAVRMATGRKRLEEWLPGMEADELKLSNTAVSSAQMAALVLLMTREEHAACSSQIRALSLQGNDIADQHFVMLIKGMRGLGAIERLDVSRNRLTKVSVAALTHVVVDNRAKKARTSSLWQNLDLKHRELEVAPSACIGLQTW
jgi:hypothetical protein